MYNGALRLSLAKGEKKKEDQMKVHREKELNETEMQINISYSVAGRSVPGGPPWEKTSRKMTQFFLVWTDFRLVNNIFPFFPKSPNNLIKCCNHSKVIYTLNNFLYGVDSP